MYSVANLKYSPFGLVLCVMALVEAGLPEDAIQKVVQDNAMKLYALG